MSSPPGGFALHSDRGRCGNQNAKITLEVCPNQHFRSALSDIASQLGISLNDVALGCFVALLYRHIQQAVIAVGISPSKPLRAPTSSSEAIKVLSCAIGERATLADIVITTSGACAELSSGDSGAALNADIVFRVVSSVSNAGPPSQDSSASVNLVLLDSGAALSMHLAFDGHLFLENRMRELLAQYQLLVEQAAVSVRRDVFEYSLITEAGRSLLPDPRAKIEMPRFTLVHEAILARAEVQPGAVAVTQSGHQWTYAELARSSANIAAHLRDKGVSAGEVVGVSGPRGYAVVAAMLGVFRSGGILVNIDPKLPVERQSIMMRQAGVKYRACVGQPSSTDECVPTIWLDSISAEVAGGEAAEFPIENLPALDLAAPAYVFFTSGSTGTPKAVLGSHTGLAHFIDWQRRTFHVDQNDRASQIIALSFDAVLRDAFLVLTTGGTLCIPADADILDPVAILKWMAAERITLVHAVPSLARAWLDHVPEGIALPKLRHLFLSGEPLTDAFLIRFRDVLKSGAVVVNLYGPTETTMVKCYHSIIDIEPGIQPIGTPMPQTQVLILNRRGYLCGLNETGEILIRTPFRTLGYLNDRDATARSFIPNPFNPNADDIVYRTGDNGRYRADGLLEIAGRIDDQVKIRGTRVEPGEIENVLAHHPGVRAVAVAAFERGNSGKYLAAYIVPVSPPSKAASLEDDIRQFAEAKLPDFMIPATFVFMDSLPLSANGKINRSALPAPVESVDAPTFVENRNAREAQLAEIWQSALGRAHVGLNDSFGALGGDSLTSIGALMAMRRIGIPETAARGIFDGLTIKQIADLDSRSSRSEKSLGRRFSHIEVPIFVRALSISLVVAGHFGTLTVDGTIKALLIVSGFSFARFQLRSIEKEGSITPVLRFMFRIALPTFLYMVFMQIAYYHSIRFSSWLFVDNFIDPNILNGSPWFIDLLLQNIAIMGAPLAMRPIREFAIKSPFAYGMIFVSVAWISSLAVPLFWNTDSLYNRVPHILIWLMLFGWCAAYSGTVGKKILLSVVFLVFNTLNFEWFGWFPLISGLAITWFDVFPVPIPNVLVRIFNALAGASLFIYLTHFDAKSVLHKVIGSAPSGLAVAFALIFGVAIWRIWDIGSSAALAGIRRLRAINIPRTA